MLPERRYSITPVGYLNIIMYPRVEHDTLEAGPDCGEEGPDCAL